MNRFDIQKLGNPTIPSPLKLGSIEGDEVFNYVKDTHRILFDTSLEDFNQLKESGEYPDCVEKAGAREKIFFDPTSTKAAIVTCGGLCPGINNVIRSMVMGLYYFYGVKDIVGIPYGYEGFIPSYGHGFVKLTPENVRDIHEFGGTILGSSRGGQDVSAMVDTIENEGINIVFAIGGDGTLRGAREIGDELRRRGSNAVVAGVPKTIDNDINQIEKSFGFETAFNVANPIIRDAHNEAKGAYNGISIVKLMGRDSGFIAASAALSMPVVNFVLIPEMDFSLEGKNGFLASLKKRLDDRSHAVIVVAEGAGQDLFEGGEQITDASGNVLHKDIGLLLKEKIDDYFKSIDYRVTIKFIDPSYIIRSAPANANDSVFCSRLAHHAVHGAMAGKTNFVVGRLNGQFVYFPISAVVDQRKKVDLRGELWFSVLESTGQPFIMK
ncbi:ATP-dependent 6-phosphofructokinase [Fulvivirga sp. M361]|uniref:ATP-dependent 6-phosphofructokinase n=1 Tax=Fulvivirga sp. M361 TaxID=2594266 RepID=UPI0021041AEE|nr:ATP-dependent 6-phosphofructokinase [Fulvivirga sp. M361]